MKPTTTTRIFICGLLVAAAGAAGFGFMNYFNARDWDLRVDSAEDDTAAGDTAPLTTVSPAPIHTSGGGGAVPGQRIVIAGSYKVSAGGVADEVTVRPVFALPPESRATTPPGNHMLEFLDGDGNVLSSVSFGIKTALGTSSTWESWRVPVTEPSGWASYRISKPAVSGAASAEGSSPAPTVLAEVTRSANAPTVSVTAPTAGQVFSGDSVTISWTGSDADSDTLEYRVAYSTDGGASYRSMGSTKSTSLSVDRIWVAGSTTAKIKVTALDGTRTTSAESPTFTVAQNPPEVFIESPWPDEILETGALILDADAHDTEDGMLDPSAIQWASDIDGNLGTGGYVMLYPSSDLEPGVHRLTATATDSSGMTGSAEVTWTYLVPPPTAPPPDPPR